MIQDGAFQIIQTIYHICDPAQEEPTLSGFVIDPDETDSMEFAYKAVSFLDESPRCAPGTLQHSVSFIVPVLEALGQDPALFVSCSQQIARELFAIFKQYPSITPGDLLFVLAQSGPSLLLAVCKYNYKTLLTRKVEPVRGSHNIYLLPKSAFFSSVKARPDEGFLLNVMDLGVQVLDKTYEIEGERTAYLQEKVLQMKSHYSEKEKLDIFNRVTRNLEKKYIGDDLTDKASLRKAVAQSVAEEGALVVPEIARRAFGKERDLEGIYREALEKAGIGTEKIEVPESQLRKKFEVQKIITENGIEISIPVQFYGDDTKIEFVPDGSGNVSLVIKNIGQLQS